MTIEKENDVKKMTAEADITEYQLQFKFTELKRNIFTYLSGSCSEYGSVSDEGGTSDVIIHCRDGSLSTYRLVLASISKMFYAELKENSSEKLVIFMPEFSVKYVKHFFLSLYKLENLEQFNDLNTAFAIHDLDKYIINGNNNLTEVEKSEDEFVEEDGEFDEGENFDCGDGFSDSENDDFNDADEGSKTKPVVISLGAIKGSRNDKDEEAWDNEYNLKSEENTEVEISEESRELKKNKSCYVWNFFNSLPNSTSRVSCIFCKEIVETDRDLIELKEHIRDFHPEEEPRKWTSDKKKTVNGKVIGRNISCFVWRYFEFIPNLRSPGANLPSEVKCKSCNTKVKLDRKATHLKHHIIQLHEPNLGKHYKVGNVLGRNKNSIVWKYFDFVPRSKSAKPNSDVTCKVCNAKVKLDKNTTNLKQHVIDVHSSQEPSLKDVKPKASYGPYKIGRNKSSFVWKYFDFVPNIKRGGGALASCNVCHKQVKVDKSSTSFKQHIIDCHSDLEPNVSKFQICSFCGKLHATPRGRKDCENRYTKNYQVFCDFEGCGKGFITKGTLKIHMLVHTGEKPFQCTYCGAQFSQNTNLKNHIQGKHSGLRPHQCDLCLATFKYSSGKYKHKCPLSKSM